MLFIFSYGQVKTVVCKHLHFVEAQSNLLKRECRTTRTVSSCITHHNIHSRQVRPGFYITSFAHQRTFKNIFCTLVKVMILILIFKKQGITEKVPHNLLHSCLYRHSAKCKSKKSTEKYRKYKLCPIVGCRSKQPLKKLSQHLRSLHPILTPKERENALKHAAVILKFQVLKQQTTCDIQKIAKKMTR